MSATAAKRVRSVERAVNILRCFDRESPTLAVTDLQRRLGLSRPTLYRLLETLEGKGLVRSFGEPKRFELGHGVVELAQSWLGRIDVTAVAQPMLNALWRPARYHADAGHLEIELVRLEEAAASWTARAYSWTSSIRSPQPQTRPGIGT